MLKTAQSFLKLTRLLLDWEGKPQSPSGAVPLSSEKMAILQRSQHHIVEALRLLEQMESVVPSSPATTPSIDTGTPSSTVGLPKDGRYTLEGSGSRVALRVDVAGSRILSGDIFTGTNAEFQASFRSVPGLVLTPQSNPVEVAIEGPKALRGTGTLRCTGHQDNQATFHLKLTAINHLWTTGQEWTWTGTYQGPEMRELGIEMEVEVELESKFAWDHQGETKTVDRCLQQAGFAVRYVGQRDEIPRHPSGQWDESQLHGLMYRLAQEPLDRPSWNLHLLLLSQARMKGLLGIMFDSGKGDTNQLPRQGLAVFQKPIQQRPDWQRKIIQTTVHELGHALNLAHRFELPVGRADSTSFMNYDWKYMGGNQPEKFWQDFAFTFDADELAFLRHGAWHHIVPGTAAFHTIAYWENKEGGYVPYIPERPGDDFSIRLLPPNTGGTFQFGQPVLLTVALKNESSQTIKVPKFMLDPKSGFLQVEIQRQSGTSSPHTRDESSHHTHEFHPIVHRCYDIASVDPVALPPGKTLSDNLNLTFGSAGFSFAEPGFYRVRATFIWQVGVRDYRTIHSEWLSIQVLAPSSKEEERDLAEFFRWDVGFYLALGGSDILDQAEQTLLNIVDRRQQRLGGALDPLLSNILRCRAINLSRDFVSYTDKGYHVRSAQPGQAYEFLSSVTDPGIDVFDPATELSNAHLLDLLRHEMDTDLDV